MVPDKTPIAAAVAAARRCARSAPVGDAGRREGGPYDSAEAEKAS